MKNILLYLCFLCCFSVLGQSAFEKGVAYYKDQQWVLAKKQLIQVEPVSKNYFKACEYLGDIAAHEKKWDKALHFYDLLLKEKPDNANYNFKYGGALGLKALELSKFQAAFYISDIKHYLKRAAALDKTHLGARWALLELYLKLPKILGGGTDVALAYANELKAISEIDGYLAYGKIYQEIEHYKQAEKYLVKALQLGDSVTCYQKLLELYIKANFAPEKINDLLQRANRAHPKENWNAFMAKSS
ncbi:lipopolysaccharide assembly protein LapB [Mesonia sp. HuA40]|uniref:tetratricopeptide repeat protein n=1 Tax=Mesonia sp. HuA40 TaxID=2602761 RepID=UPI0011C95979|nr:hypothetical protein [Mesonia sp. HuA40]TXK75343.1 hypothetical protein FT993_01055 [Mesonia sp. HuA40]